MRLFALLALFVLSNAALASSELDLALSSDVIALDYRAINDDSGSMWGVGAMYNDPLSATLASVSFNVVGQATANGEVHTGLGFKGVVHDTFQTAGSIALGGLVRYQPESLKGFGFSGQLYYAPDILNSNDADQYFEFIARVSYAVHPHAHVFLGWTSVNVKYDDPIIKEVEIDQSFNVGFSLKF